MADLSSYYASARKSISGINPDEAADLIEDGVVIGATGATLGLMSAAFGGLDAKIAGMTVPVDGLISAGLAVAGLATKNKQLKTAAIAAGGSASTRTFQAFFKKGFGAHGEFSEGVARMGFGGLPQFGGQSAHDRLVEAAKAL